MMHGRGQSDSSIVPKKTPNNAPDRAAEVLEGRVLTKENLLEQNVPRTQGRVGMPSALKRVRAAVLRDRQQRFTALFHHVYDLKLLRAAYGQLKRTAAAGVDGETWKHYGRNLDENLRDLSERLRRGAYRASPVRRAYIAKADGRQRPLGVPTLEDKIVQRAVVNVLNEIYEPVFFGFSYGYRPGRRPHAALDALAVAIHRRNVNWVLDADIQSFFDTLDHGWLVQFVEHLIGDRRIVRLIQKWLRAGVLEDGQLTLGEVGTVQGGSISPLLANIYLHYVFDLWVQQWRKKARGDVAVIRYADDFVVGFEHRDEAEQFQVELAERLAKFSLTLHPQKTRLIAFGRQAARNWRERGGPKPGTFNFLGFTHSCGKTRKGRFIVLRRTMRDRMRRKLSEVKAKLEQRLHDPIPEVGEYLSAVVTGHYQYYGVPLNYDSLRSFWLGVTRLWRASLACRSQRGRVSWERVTRLVDHWLPPPRIRHPWPWVRFDARSI